jgi:acyl carrier protein
MARAELRSLIAERTAARRAAASATPSASVKEILWAVLVDELGRDPAAVADQDLVTSGVIDSFTIARLVAQIEGRWGVSVPNTEFVVTNFSSLEAMSALVERLTNDGGRTDAEPH